MKTIGMAALAALAVMVGAVAFGPADTTRVSSAAAARDSDRSGNRPDPPTPAQVLERRSRLFAEVAERLDDKSAADVAAAVRAALVKRLDQAVEDERLTREQADAVVAAYDSGERPPRPAGARPGGPRPDGPPQGPPPDADGERPRPPAEGERPHPGGRRGHHGPGGRGRRGGPEAHLFGRAVAEELDVSFADLRAAVRGAMRELHEERRQEQDDS